MILIQKEAWNIIEEKTEKTIEELRSTIIEGVERIENETMDQNYAIASWYEIFRLPW